MSIYDSFTNRYSFTKTLRFELKPTPETQIWLRKPVRTGKNPLQIDEEIDELYNKEMKPMLDGLHEKFITESLENIKLNTDLILQIENCTDGLIQASKKNKTELNSLKKAQQNLLKRLRENIVSTFDQTGDVWKTQLPDSKSDKKDKGYKILTGKSMLNLLQRFYPEKTEVINRFKGFTTYFSGYNQNRENYYSSSTETTAVANRLADVNLIRFLENKRNLVFIAKTNRSFLEFSKYFESSYYQNCLTQAQIEEFNENIVGTINSKKNLLFQNLSKEEKSKIKLPNLKKLYKQIGCRTRQEKAMLDQGKSIYPPFIIKAGLGFEIEKDVKGHDRVWEAMSALNKQVIPQIETVWKNYQEFFRNWNEYKLDEIWFDKQSLNTISGKWFGGANWNVIGRALNYVGAGKMNDGNYKIPDFVCLADVRDALEALEQGVDIDVKKKKSKINAAAAENKKYAYTPESLFKDLYKEHFKRSLFESFLSVWEAEIKNIYERITAGHKDPDGKWQAPYLKKFEEVSQARFDRSVKDNKGRSTHTLAVKNLVEDGYLRFFQVTKYHRLVKKGIPVARPFDSRFYDELDKFWEENDVVIYHKAFQATMTKKIYNRDKIQLNFDHGTLLQGWADDKKDTHNFQYNCSLLRKGTSYYLIVMEKASAFGLKKNSEQYDTVNSACQLMLFKSVISKTIYGSSYIGKYKSEYATDKDKLPIKIMIDRLKSIISEKSTIFPALTKILETEYTDLKRLANDLGEREHVSHNFVNIKSEFIDNLEKEGKIYLFKISNQNIEVNSKTPNLHTLYFDALFTEENNNLGVYKLLGGGHMYLRRKSIPVEMLVLSEKEGKKFTIIKNRRFTSDKYQLNIPIKINYTKAETNYFEFNEQIISKSVVNYDDITYLGIDRGENHLLYISIIDRAGKIIESRSLNFIKDKDYGKLLGDAQDKRKLARLNWEEIGKITNLKEGYLSQAVHEIYRRVIDHNAVIIMEDLNSEFKAKRLSLVEKSVYKKFELALSRKLNHLILKDRRAHEPGGVLNAYQLTPYIPQGKIADFGRIKQWGIMFYTRANYTSTTDPLTGWRQHKYIYASDPVKKIIEFFDPEHGVRIDFDQDRKCFRFRYEYAGKCWDLYAYSGMERFYWNQSERKNERYNLFAEFEKLFAGFDKTVSINRQIQDKEFNWKRLAFYWKLFNQIRNKSRSESGEALDFLQSPVWSEKYEMFFDSRCPVTDYRDLTNGDAVGAYNIARKGRLLLEHIREGYGYYISDDEWDIWLQGEDKWKVWASDNLKKIDKGDKT